MTTQVGSGPPVSGKGTPPTGQEPDGSGEEFAQSLASALSDEAGTAEPHNSVTGPDAQPVADQSSQGETPVPVAAVPVGVLSANVASFWPATPVAAVAVPAPAEQGAFTSTTSSPPEAEAAAATGGAAATPAGVVAAGKADLPVQEQVTLAAPAAPKPSTVKPGQGPAEHAGKVAPAPNDAKGAPVVPQQPLPTQAVAGVVNLLAPASSPALSPSGRVSLAGVSGTSTEQVAPAVDDTTGLSRQAPVQVATTGPALTIAPTIAPNAQRVQELAAQVSAHVRAVATMPDGSYAMTVRANPVALGPVTISVRLNEGTVEVAMAAAHEHARAALTEASPAIRRELAVAGLICDRVSVSADHGTGSSHQQAGHDAQPDRGARQGPHEDRRARTWMDSGEPHETQTPALVTPKTTPTGVDVRV